MSNPNPESNGVAVRSIACSADFPLMVKGDFVYDAGGMRLLVCSPARDCSQIFREREVDADPHFICPECGRLGQRMAELQPDQERYFTTDGIFIPPNAEATESQPGADAATKKDSEAHGN